jgi:hypothetical protein
MEEPLTCGEGLAANAVLPAQLGGVTVTVAKVLNVHTRALDPSDPNARAEYDAYTRLVAEFRDIAAKLEATAEQMAGSRDMPMVPHDDSAMTGPEPLAAFEELVAAKQKLLGLLQEQTEQDRRMLAQMRAASGSC